MHNIIQMETSAKLYSLPFGNVKTYLFVLLFVAGNIALPQLCHLVPAGGPTLLPIYFFTLIAAYKYGFKVGLLTALLSPVINHLLFAMPAAAVLPAILIKSGLLAGTPPPRRSCCTLCQEYLFIGIAGCSPLLSNYRYGL